MDSYSALWQIELADVMLKSPTINMQHLHPRYLYKTIGYARVQENEWEVGLGKRRVVLMDGVFQRCAMTATLMLGRGRWLSAAVSVQFRYIVLATSYHQVEQSTICIIWGFYQHSLCFTFTCSELHISIPIWTLSETWDYRCEAVRKSHHHHPLTFKYSSQPSWI